MNKFKMSNLSFSLIVVSLMNSSLLGILFPFMIKNSGNSIFISLVISFIFGLLILFLFTKVLNYLPDKDIFGKIDETLPKALRLIVYLLFTIFLFSVVLLIYWRLLTFISSEFLVDTPTIFIGIVLLLPITYVLFYDFDTLGRIITICVFISFLLIIFNVFSLSGSMDFENLKPIIDNDYFEIFKSSIVFALSYFAPIFLTLSIPKSNIENNSKTTKVLFKTYIISFLIVSVIFFSIVSVLGISVAKLYTYPSYVVLKNINILNFIENIENISVNALLFLMTATISFILLTLKKMIMHIFNLKIKLANKMSIICFIIPLITIIMFLLPKESFINRHEEAYASAILFLGIMAINLFVYIYGKIKKKS